MKKSVAILLMAVACSGCKTFEKQKLQAEAFYRSYPNELASVCADQFPVKEKVIRGKDSLITDTTYKYLVVDCPPNGKDTIKIKVPVTKTITNKFTRVDTVRTENTAKLELATAQNIALAADYEKSTQQLEAANKSAHIRLIWIIGLTVLLAFIIVWQFYKFFSGGFISKL